MTTVTTAKLSFILELTLKITHAHTFLGVPKSGSQATGLHTLLLFKLALKVPKPLHIHAIYTGHG